MYVSKLTKGILTLLLIFEYWVIYELWLPPLSIAYVTGALFFGIGAAILAIILFMWIPNPITSDDEELLGLLSIISGVASAILFILYVIISFIGSPIFNANTRYNQIGEVEEKSFVEDMLQIDNSQIPIVDTELANKLADKKMGEEVALGSQQEVGNFTNKQSVNGKLLYVAPLEHRGLTKWFSNKAGTAGYLMVSATNTNDVTFVKELNGEKLYLKYLPSAYFGSDLKRHIRASGYRTIGLADTDYVFEIDDEGTPYWIVPTFKNVTLWGSPETTGVITCNAINGKCNWYSVDEAPSWIDIVQPESFVKKQLENYGRYVEGFINFSKKNMLSVTEHITTVYNEGKCYYFTGMSSVGKDEGTVGFFMIDTRTKEAIFYRMIGATEQAAMGSSTGGVQDMKYTPSVPIPLNVSGIPTYFMPLKDQEGLIKSYAMVNIENYDVVGNGKTIQATKRAYLNAMNTKNISIDLGQEAYAYTERGTVTRITQNVEDGNTYYYIILNDDPSKLYLAPYTVSNELPITRAGDTVEVSYIDESNGVINIVSFDNIAFSQEISAAQEKINEEMEKYNIINEENNNVTAVNPEESENVWNSLSDEEKAKLIGKIGD